MANTDIDIASHASVMVGGQPITSLDPPDNSTEAEVASNLYTDIVDDLLGSYPWRFAMQQVKLDRKLQEPVGRWDAAYSIPNIVLLVRTVTVNEHPIRYDRIGDDIVSNAGIDDEVILDFTFHPSESVWPPTFTLLAEFTLAAAFAPAITGRDGLSTLFEGKASRQETKARNVDSQSQTVKKLRTNRFLTRR